MTKAEFIESIRAQTGFSNHNIEYFLSSLGHVIKRTIADGDRVTLPEVGTFSAQPRAARAGRNPKTGEAIEIPAKTTVKFKASQKLLGQLPPPSTEG